MAKETTDLAHHHSSMLLGKLIFALALLGSAYMVSQSMGTPEGDVYVSSIPAEHTIDVSATATTEVEPDLLVIGLRVESEALEAGQSQEDNARDVEAVMAAVKALGVKEENIKTSHYSVDIQRESHYICEGTDLGREDDGVVEPGVPEPMPAYEYDYERSDCYWDYVMVGYKTTHTLSVEVEELDKGGDIIDAAVAAGASEVDYISFTLKTETRDELKRSLLEEASATAKVKAGKIANGLGVSLGKAMSGGESADYYYDYPRYAAYDYAYAESGSAPKTTVAPGEVSITATVYASFEIS